MIVTQGSIRNDKILSVELYNCLNMMIALNHHLLDWSETALMFCSKVEVGIGCGLVSAGMTNVTNVESSVAVWGLVLQVGDPSIRVTRHLIMTCQYKSQ